MASEHTEEYKWWSRGLTGVQQQAMKESGTLIRIDLDFRNAFKAAGHSCLWAIFRGLGVPDVDFLEDLHSKLWMKITVGTGCSAPIQFDTGMVQGSVISPLLFDLFLNALLRLLDATRIRVMRHQDGS